MKRQAPGAQRPKDIEKIGEGGSIAQGSDSPGKPSIRSLPRPLARHPGTQGVGAESTPSLCPDASRRRLLAAGLALPMLSLAACRPPQPPVRVAGIVWVGYEPLFLARELGYYDQTRLRLVESGSNTTSLMALATGDVEAATLTLDECLVAREGGLDVRIILVFDESAGADVVMARPEIRTLTDLRGRRIGVEANAVGALMLAKLLETAGLAAADVVKVTLTSERHVAAYRAGEVDALVTFEPYATQLVKAGARRLLDSRSYPGLIVDVLAARTEALQTAPDQFEQLCAGYFRALEYLERVPTQAGDLMGRRMGLGPDEVLAAEALVRWRHPVQGVIPPASFIPLAEESGLIVPLGEWVLRESCRLINRLDQSGHSLRIAVNVSPRQFREPDFVQRVRHILAETGADPTHLMLEITENLLVEQPHEAVASMTELATLGLRFAIDDFGTDYSSLAYLKRLPLAELKIDKGFVQDVPQDANDVALVETILSMARHLGLEVVAEGVETAGQLEFLASRGCGRFQGYYWQHPMPSEDWLAALAPGRTLQPGQS